MTHARTDPRRPRKTYLRKGIHWMPFEFEAWLGDCRKAMLTPEQVGVFIHVVSLMWTDQERLSDDFRRLAVRIGFDVRQTKRIIAALVEKGLLNHADGRIWNARADRDLAKLRGNYAGAKKYLSEKASVAKEAARQIRDIDSPIVPRDSDLDVWDNPKAIRAAKGNDPRFWVRLIERETRNGYWPVAELGPSPADEPTALHDEIDDRLAEILRGRGIAAPRQIAPMPFTQRGGASTAMGALL